MVSSARCPAGQARTVSDGASPAVPFQDADSYRFLCSGFPPLFSAVWEVFFCVAGAQVPIFFFSPPRVVQRLCVVGRLIMLFVLSLQTLEISFFWKSLTFSKQRYPPLSAAAPRAVSPLRPVPRRVVFFRPSCCAVFCFPLLSLSCRLQAICRRSLERRFCSHLEIFFFAPFLVSVGPLAPRAMIPLPAGIRFPLYAYRPVPPSVLSTPKTIPRPSYIGVGLAHLAASRSSPPCLDLRVAAFPFRKGSFRFGNCLSPGFSSYQRSFGGPRVTSTALSQQSSVSLLCFSTRFPSSSCSFLLLGTPLLILHHAPPVLFLFSGFSSSSPSLWSGL